MKNRTHGLTEIEIELAKLLMADCKTTGDVQARLKVCSRERSSKCLRQRGTTFGVREKFH